MSTLDLPEEPGKFAAQVAHEGSSADEAEAFAARQEACPQMNFKQR